MRSAFRTLAVLAVVLLAGLTAAAAPAAAKSYFAERFDSHVRVMPGGALEVTETVVFHFEGGSFDHVYREIPTRRTDGIQIVSASLDGRAFPIGDGVDRVQVTGRSKLRVQWRFAPLTNSSHVFVLTYIARGVVSQTDTADVLQWRALPTEHQYRIASSTIEFELPAAAAAGGAGAVPAPSVEWHRVDGPTGPGCRRHGRGQRRGPADCAGDRAADSIERLGGSHFRVSARQPRDDAAGMAAGATGCARARTALGDRHRPHRLCRAHRAVRPAPDLRRPAPRSLDDDPVLRDPGRARAGPRRLAALQRADDARARDGDAVLARRTGNPVDSRSAPPASSGIAASTSAPGRRGRRSPDTSARCSR